MKEIAAIADRGDDVSDMMVSVTGDSKGMVVRGFKDKAAKLPPAREYDNKSRK